MHRVIQRDGEQTVSSLDGGEVLNGRNPSGDARLLAAVAGCAVVPSTSRVVSNLYAQTNAALGIAFRGGRPVPRCEEDAALVERDPYRYEEETDEWRAVDGPGLTCRQYVLTPQEGERLASLLNTAFVAGQKNANALLEAAIEKLLNTPAMNADEMDEVEIAAVESARTAIAIVRGGGR